MIVLGLVLVIIGWIIGLGLLLDVGIFLLIIGVVLALVCRSGRAVGGRTRWY